MAGDYSGFGSSAGDNLMTEAKRVNAQNAGSSSHKIASTLKYAIRKKLLKAPITFAKAAIDKIPYAGSAVNWAFDKAVDHVAKKDKDAKSAKYREAINQGADDREALRKLAKWEAKSLKALTEKLESNQVKLRDAASKVQSTYNAFSGNPTDATADAILIAICEEERYINKIALMIAGVVLHAGDIEGYIDTAREANLTLQKTLVADLDAVAEKEGTAIRQPGPPLPPGGARGPQPARPGAPPPIAPWPPQGQSAHASGLARPGAPPPAPPWPPRR